MTNEGILKRLEDFLRHQDDAIRSADLLALTQLVPEGEQMLVALSDGLNPTRLAALRRTAAQNARRLDYVLKGVRSARRRIESIASAGQRLQTYDGAGRAATITGPLNTVERRG